MKTPYKCICSYTAFVEEVINSNSRKRHALDPIQSEVPNKVL